MSRLPYFLLIFAATLAVFGWWGTRTPEGRRRFDEMAGIIPAAAWYASWALALVAIVWLTIAALRARG